MPDTRLPHAALLDFAADTLVHSNLSGAAVCAMGDRHWLWVAGDEACGLDRLALLPDSHSGLLRFGEAQDFPLAELLDLPGAADDEADIEGLAWHDGWLWLTGSHGLKRKNAKPSKSDEDNARRLARTPLDGNRRLIARIPVEPGPDGAPRPVRKAADGRRAQRLKGDAQDNELTRALADDPHLAPFLAIPGKDNGLDIEGLALLGPHLLLGLRGPVLRGWSCILEIALAPHGDGLRLAPLDDAGTRVRKHFIPLDGLGVRDLCRVGDDLHILAGPTMVLDGDIRLYTWRGAVRTLQANTAAVTFAPAPALCLDLPHGRGTDRAEALCVLPEALGTHLDVPPGSPLWLVLYDAPAQGRTRAPHGVLGDVLVRR